MKSLCSAILEAPNSGIRVYTDPSPIQDVILPYKGVAKIDITAFYCPYIPLILEPVEVKIWLTLPKEK